MATEITLPEHWSDIGAPPLVIELLGPRPVAYLAAAVIPSADRPSSNLLTLGEAIMVGGEGLRIYVRPDTSGGTPARLKVRTPSEFLADPVTVNVATPLGRLVLQAMTNEGVSWRAIAVGTIAAADVYQQLAAEGAARNGGYIVNTSPAGTAPLWVDPTGASGDAMSMAAMPVYAAQDGSSAPGAWRVPPTLSAVTIMGPAGATFQGFFG